MMKFKTFEPTTTYVGSHNEYRSATTNLNEWIEAHPGVEIINWRTTPADSNDKLYITIQYWEN